MTMRMTLSGIASRNSRAPEGPGAGGPRTVAAGVRGVNAARLLLESHLARSRQTTVSALRGADTQRYRSMPQNLLYAQSGGVTAVINATACGVIETARAHAGAVGTVYAARDGILGALTEDLVDTGAETAHTIAALRHTPGGAFGSCRYKLRDFERNRGEYERLVAVLRAHDIGYFLYNGGNDSMFTALQVAQVSQRLGHAVRCIGVPKTVDNDLPHTDCCPGFGSAAKYVAVSIAEADLDVAAMASTSTRVFVLEVMGRHAGWIAAAAALARRGAADGPHVLLLPEAPYDEAAFLARVEASVGRVGHCTVVVAEGLRDRDGQLLGASERMDAFGHAQLGGVGPRIAQRVADRLGLKTRWAVADYLQRSARHIASATDLEQAYAVGRVAVERAVEGCSGVMTTIERTADEPYAWRVGTVPLNAVAAQERTLPPEFIGPDGMDVTPACVRYLRPLIAGEAPPPFRDGLPDYVRLRGVSVARRLPTYALP
jgi:ATP-dependent phosphofructokinase / diphosphate-dependent phosphofructokinase